MPLFLRCIADVKYMRDVPQHIDGLSPAMLLSAYAPTETEDLLNPQQRNISKSTEKKSHAAFYAAQAKQSTGWARLQLLARAEQCEAAAREYRSKALRGGLL